MQDVLARAEELVGVPYKLHGESTAGWDCIGCVRYVRRVLFGRETPLGGVTYTRTHADQPELAEQLILGQLETWRQLERLIPGCVVLFERLGRKDHVGVMLDNRNFIHAQYGSETSTGDIRGTWKARVRGFYETA